MINLFFVIHDYSGARTYANELLGYLALQKEIAVHKVFMDSRHYKEYTEVKDGKIICIHIPAMKRKGSSLDKYSSRCIDLMVNILQGKQNLVFHLNYSTQVKLGVEARKRFGARLIYTLHFLPNYFSYLASGVQFPDDLVPLGDVLEKQINSEAEHIICVTRFAKESIQQWYKIPENKVTAIHNGIGLAKQHKPLALKQKERIRNSLGFAKEEQIVLYVGKLESRKGIKHLIRVFNKLSKKNPNTRLVLVGDGDFNEVFNNAKGCWGRITLTGKISFDEVKQLYQIADIGVIPSVFEQCSYVALEMMQYGLPVVVTAAPGLKELYVDQKNALIVPLGNTNSSLMELEVIEDELERSIKMLLVDEKLRKKMGINAITNWETQYTSIHMGQATMQVYQQIQNKVIHMLKLSNIKSCKLETI